MLLPLCDTGRVGQVGSNDILLFFHAADVMSSAADSLLTQLPEGTKLQLPKERAAPVRKSLLCK